MKYLLLAFLVLPLSIRGATLGVSYDSGTRNVLQTDLDYVGATANFTSQLQLNGVSASTISQATWFTGAGASATWTFNLTGTDPVITFGSGSFAFTGTGAFSGNLTPVSSDGAALGTTALMWSDVFLASGGIINWNNGDVLITHSANLLTLSGGDLALPNMTLTGNITFPDNIRQTFNPGADAAGINVGSHAGDPGTPSNGDLWYSTSANALRARINGSTVSLGEAGSGGAPVGTMVNAGASVQYNFTYYTDTTGTNMSPALIGTDSTLTNLYSGGFLIHTLTVTNGVAIAGDLTVGGSVTVTNGPIQLGITGVTIAHDSDGAISFTGSSAGADENWTFNLDDTANTVVMSSSSGVTLFDWLTGSFALSMNSIELSHASANTLTASGGILSIEGVVIPTISSTATFTGKTYDAAGTGNVLLQTKQLILQRPDYGDGAGAVPQTNTFTASGLMHYTFSGNAETNANWAVYEFDCPSDLNTAVEMTARFGFLSGGTDADDYVFHLTYDQVAAGTAYPTGTGVDLLPIVMTVTPVTPAAGDLQYSSAVTLTGWAAALTPGRAMQVRIARLQNGQDDGARDVQLVITYGSTL